MYTLTYFAVFEPTVSGYSIYFPNFPGCISTGSDFEDASRQAKEALTIHIDGMLMDGDELPPPSSTAQIDPDTAPGYILSPITIVAGAALLDRDS